MLDKTCPKAPTTPVLNVEENTNDMIQDAEPFREFKMARDSICNEAFRFFDEGVLVLRLFMKREFSPSDVGIGPANKKSQAVSPAPTGPPVMADAPWRLLWLPTRVAVVLI